MDDLAGHMGGLADPMDQVADPIPMDRAVDPTGRATDPTGRVADPMSVHRSFEVPVYAAFLLHPIPTSYTLAADMFV